ncbi:hypothetical protein R9X47_00170 [Wukongibacter baidiensis]|uniref:hypothetical protein n=1 Tax=Wukongibacter baidiensis TaxID=1723361 RepID=UPI003D7F8C78
MIEKRWSYISREEINNIMEYLEDTIIELDDEYRIQYIKTNNRSNKGILREIIGKKLDEVFEKKYANYFSYMLFKSSADEESLEGEIEYDKNGVISYYRFKIIHIRRIILIKFRKISEGILEVKN